MIDVKRNYRSTDYIDNIMNLDIWGKIYENTQILVGWYIM